MPDEVPTVSYPITLLIDRLQAQISDIRADLAGRLDRIEAKLDAKADRSDLSALDRRVSVLEAAGERHAAEVAVVRERQQVSRTWKQYVPTTALGAVTVVVLILQLVRK